jgi:hypothetical protein
MRTTAQAAVVAGLCALPLQAQEVEPIRALEATDAPVLLEEPTTGLDTNATTEVRFLARNISSDPVSELAVRIYLVEPDGQDWGRPLRFTTRMLKLDIAPGAQVPVALTLNGLVLDETQRISLTVVGANTGRGPWRVRRPIKWYHIARPATGPIPAAWEDSPNMTPMTESDESEMACGSWWCQAERTECTQTCGKCGVYSFRCLRTRTMCESECVCKVRDSWWGGC